MLLSRFNNSDNIPYKNPLEMDLWNSAQDVVHCTMCETTEAL